MMMKSLVDNHTFANAEEMKQHYRAVRLRIYGKPKANIQDPELCVKKRIKRIKVSTVLEHTRAFYKISLIDLLQGRSMGYVRARHISMWLAHRVGKKSMHAIVEATNFGLNTVYEAIRKIDVRRLHDPQLYAETNALMAKLEALPWEETT